MSEQKFSNNDYMDEKENDPRMISVNHEEDDYDEVEDADYKSSSQQKVDSYIWMILD